MGLNDSLLGGLVRLLGQEDSLDVGEDSTLGDGDSGQKLVQLLVIPDGELEVTGDDPGLLVVTGSVTSQLEDLGSQVLQDSGHVDSCSIANVWSVVSFLHVAVNSGDWKLETSAARTGLRFRLNFATFSTSGHVYYSALNHLLIW